GLVFFPRGSNEAMRWWTLFGTALTLGVSLAVFVAFYNDTLIKNNAKINIEDRHKASLAYRAEQADARKTGDPEPADDWVTRVAWVPQFKIDYFLGIDGISMALVLLTTVICFLSMIASWRIEKFVRGYCMLFLVLETGMLGTFLALDFFLFYIFWEVMLLPMYF